MTKVYVLYFVLDILEKKRYNININLRTKGVKK